MRILLSSVASVLLLLFAGCGGTDQEGGFQTVRTATEGAGRDERPGRDSIGSGAKESPEPGNEEDTPEEPDEGGADPPSDLPPTGDVTLVAAEIDPVAEVTPPEGGEPAPTPPLVPEPEFRRERGGALRVTFDDLDLKRVIGIERPTVDTPGDLPEWLTALDGERIRIGGFMKPNERLTGLTRFIFVRDNGVCCFGPQAKLYDMIHVRLSEGTTTDYIQGRSFDVEGTFRIEPTLFLDEVVYFYHLDDAAVLRR